MALPLQLSNIKSSGIYRFVIDKSEIPGAANEIMRLVVGYSEIGPFNTPVYIRDVEQFVKIFGDTNKRLERYGVFFHRMCKQALEAGPIYALNLKTFNVDPNDDERVDAFSFNLDSQATSLGQPYQIPVETLYDTNRFWVLRPEHLADDDITSIFGTSSGYVTIAHTDANNLDSTIIVRRVHAEDLPQYQSTFSQWFNATLNGEPIPDYLEGHENDTLNEYFGEIYVFRGNLYNNLTVEEQQLYFDILPDGTQLLRPTITNAFGEEIDSLQSIAQLQDSNFVNAYRGILLPNFYDAFGGPLSLDTIFNNDYDSHHLMMYLNGEILDRIAGDNCSSAFDSIVPTSTTVFTSFLDTSSNFSGGVDVAMQESSSYLSMRLVPTIQDIPLSTTYTDTHALETNLARVSFDVKVKCSNEGEPEFEEFEIDSTTYQWLINHYGQIWDPSHQPQPEGVVWDVIQGNEPENPASETDYNSNPIENPMEVNTTYDADINIRRSENDNIFDSDHRTTHITVQKTVVCYVIREKNAPGSEEEYTYTWIKNEPTYTIKLDNNKDFVLWSYLLGIDMTEHDLLSQYCGQTYTANVEELISPLKEYASIGYICSELRGYTKKHVRPGDCNGVNPCSKQQWIDTYILAALTRYKGLREALTNNVDIEYRYLIDTFDTPICDTNPDYKYTPKLALAMICKMKDNVLGILNYPKMQYFNKPQYKTDNTIDFAKVISHVLMPMQNEGASWVAFYSQFIYQDPFTGVKTTVPSAAVVSNEYLRKYTERFEYSIVAGTNYGVVYTNNMIGPDYNFSRTDRDILEPYGLNVLLFDPRKGTYINSNKTAQQRPFTTLSSINVRELVIHIQNAVHQILLDKHWEFNTATLRSMVAESTRAFMDRVLANDGCYAYDVVCDESNNTPDVIDNEMFVIDIAVEPTRGAGKMVQRLTLYRKGGIASASV